MTGFFDLPDVFGKKTVTKKAKKKVAKKATKKRVAKKATKKRVAKKATKKRVVKKATKKRVAKKVTKKKAVRRAAKKKVTRPTASPGSFRSSPEWKGVPNNLRAVFDFLNKTYFTKLAALGKRPIVVDALKWGPEAVSRHGVFRAYRGGPRDGFTQITIFGQLKGPQIPAQVMGAVLFHEMVHAYCWSTGQTACRGHDREFRARERLFNGLKEALAWRNNNVLGAGVFTPGCPFKRGDLLKHRRKTFSVVGCDQSRNIVMLQTDRGTPYRATIQRALKLERVRSSNPRGLQRVPVEADVEIMEWTGPSSNPRGLQRVPVEADVEIMEWRA